MSFPSDIRILEAECIFRREKARVPLKFGGVIMDEAIFFICRVKVENRRGDVADGYGGIFLSDVWAWPTPSVEHAVRERVMQRVAEEYAKRVAGYKQFAHPIDIFLDTEGELHPITREAVQSTIEEMPFLAALVSASPVDAAVHDAFGNVNGIDSYLGYGKEQMREATHYLARALTPNPSPTGRGEWLAAARSRYLDDFLRPVYLPEVPMFHLVGGLDKLIRTELTDDDPQDDLPVSLDDWIQRDGLFCLKVKLRGTDLDWDLQRMLDVHRVAMEARTRMPPTPALPHKGGGGWELAPSPLVGEGWGGGKGLFLTADTNEMCDAPEYMIELLTKLRECAPLAFDALLYVEQPTHRDLQRFPFRMDGVAKLKPVFVDESLTDMPSYDLARELGATGVALKTCKCQSSCLLMVARCHLENVPYAVQDLTNPSLALLQSVGLAARIHTVMGVEANSRQFFPAASRDIERVHDGIVSRANGVARTHSLRGTGLGYQIESINL